MMARKAEPATPTQEMLSEILSVLRDLLIVVAHEAGMKKKDVRRVLGVADARVTETWQYLSKPAKE